MPLNDLVSTDDCYLFFFQFGSIDFDHMSHHYMGPNNLICKFWINTSYWVQENDTLMIRMSGQAYLHSKFKRALTKGFEPKRQVSDFKLIQENEFPIKTIKFSCSDFSGSWLCSQRVDRCKKILIALGSKVVISKHRIQENHSFELLSNYLLGTCQKSNLFSIDIMGRTISFYGAEHYFRYGFIQSQSFFDCIDLALDTLQTYKKETKNCATIHNGKNNTAEYGFINESSGRKSEYVKKRFSTEKPYHSFLACSPRLATAKLRTGFDGSRYWPGPRDVYCYRETSYIIRSFNIFSTCHKFVASCLDTFECLERRSFCFSERFGSETGKGFLVDHNFTAFTALYESSCIHWGVELRNYAGKLYCIAVRLFRLKSFSTFCQSYEWICQKVLHCFKTREVCGYSPNKTSNNTITEQHHLGIFNFQMPNILDHKNPAAYIQSLYKCNKKYGYGNYLHLQFVTTECRHLECDLDIFKIMDKELFDSRKFALLGLLREQGMPQFVAHTSNFTTIWLCKRDVLSLTTCPKFLQLCELIKHCLSNEQVRETQSLDLPSDDSCYSPLPVSTLAPLEATSLGLKVNFPGLGPSVNYILPLETSLAPKFGRVNSSGWEWQRRMDVGKRRTKLFFDIFMEDCRHKYQFEGFLYEPDKEKIDYLTCAVPFGINGENPLIRKGCSQVREACDNMKKCYVHHAKYFGFDSFINQNGFTLAIIIMIVSLMSTALALFSHCWLPSTGLSFQQYIEYVIFTSLGFTSISLLVFSLENYFQFLNPKNAVSIEVLLPTMRLCWHLGGYILTTAFHVYVIFLTFRFYY